MTFSFVIVARAQPDWSSLACIATSSLGYACFWLGVTSFKKRKARFWTSVLWFGAISAIHLNWFFADRYVGHYIYPFLLLLFVTLGIQFGLATLLIGKPQEMGWLQMLGISGGWAFCEWARLFLLSGYSLDPIGIALSGTVPGMQIASAFGIYGLSWIVLLTNLIALRFFSLPSKRLGTAWLLIAVAPYLFGAAHLFYYTKKADASADATKPIKSLLVQTALIPEEKVRVNGSIPYTPVEQWRRILTLLAPYLNEPVDLIVLPEGAVPYGTHAPIYSRDEIAQIFHEVLGKEVTLLSDKPKMGNGAWAQALANSTEADLVVGLEDFDRGVDQGKFQFYNAAFLVRPHQTQFMRYEKRVLVPMGEYIPFDWCKKILSKYGIMDSYTPGKEAKVFSTARAPLGLSVCYEETYGFLMRQARQKGAELLVNITNDVWYPRSRLPKVHFFHGRLRAVELGVPLLRACNTGVTCGTDPFGRILGELPCEDRDHHSTPAVLSIALPLFHYATLYAFWGDLPLMLSGAILFFVFLLSKYFNLKKFTLKTFLFYSLRKN